MMKMRTFLQCCCSWPLATTTTGIIIQETTGLAHGVLSNQSSSCRFDKILTPRWLQGDNDWFGMLGWRCPGRCVFLRARTHKEAGSATSEPSLVITALSLMCN